MFKAIIEQERIKKLLAGSLANHEVSHAYLFVGKKGIGKTMMALEFAKALLCRGDEKPCGACIPCEKIEHGNHPDVLITQPGKGESAIKIDQIRKLIATLPVKPFESDLRVSIIKGGDKMTPEAQNALLKSLEEPEPHNVFIITAENLEKMLNTIRSRCQVLSFEPVSDAGIREILRQKGYAPGEAVDQAVYSCEGSPGKALEFLENTELESLKIEALNVFYAILKGDTFKVFAFSEKIGKDKNASAEVLNFLLVWFHSMALFLEGAEDDGNPYYSWQVKYASVLTPRQNSRIAEILFEFMNTLQYNVNLRLQWESVLLKI